MPCFSPVDDQIERDDDRLASAVLCAFTRTLIDQNHLAGLVSLVDWRRAGVTQQDFMAWWARHKAKDAGR